MKKVVCKLIPLLLVVGCVIGLSACGFASGNASFSNFKPELKLEKAETRLKDEGYNVVVQDSSEYGVKTIFQASKQSSNGTDTLYIIECESSKMAQLTYDVMLASYQSRVDSTQAQYDLLSYQLKTYRDELKRTEIDELEDQIEQYEEELEEYAEDFTAGVSGKFVWFGTVDAAKDSK